MTAVVTSEPTPRVRLEPEGAARGVEDGCRHPLEHAAPGADANLGRVEVDPLDHGEASAEIPREDDGAMTPVQDQPGRRIDDERPGQDAGGPEEIRHAGLAIRGRDLVRAKITKRGDGKTRPDIVR